MNKEELEKEVEEYLENEHCENVCTCDEIEECKKGIRIRCMSFNCKKELIVNFAEPREKRIAELEAQIEKLIDFVLSKTECCDVCPITDTCINSEGTCPYAGILSKGEEAVTREWLMQKIAKEIKEND